MDVTLNELPNHCGVQRLYRWYQWLRARNYPCEGSVVANLNSRGNRGAALQP